MEECPEPEDLERRQRRAEARLGALSAAEDVSAEALRVYGSDLRATGVVHVTAVWHRDDGPLVTLRTGDGAPRIAYDDLALGLARARADAIITTGEVLRREPGLRHELPGPGALPRALADWRRRVLGKQAPPVLWVMTRSGEVDLDHAAFDRAGRSVVYAGRAAVWGMESRAADIGVELVVAKTPSVRDSVERLRGEFGAATIVVEAGPSVARCLYDDSTAGEPAARDAAVDELMLTVLHRGELETRWRGPSFLSRGEIEESLGRAVSCHLERSPFGAWELARYRKS
jgi:riboflavin biosynthesis pyrimidine reductase